MGESPALAFVSAYLYSWPLVSLPAPAQRPSNFRGLLLPKCLGNEKEEIFFEQNVKRVRYENLNHVNVKRVDVYGIGLAAWKW